MNGKDNTPEWYPVDADRRFFTTSVVPGIKLGKSGECDGGVSSAVRRKRRTLTFDEYKRGVLAGDKTVLARAITLIESNAPKHFETAQNLIGELLPYSGNAYRIGITGVPGAGKSSFIEAFGTMLCNDFSKKVAVLAVDPSSSLTGGSILGDKTRMEKLSRCDNAFIRPSPSGGMLGGVARKSRETMILCEAAGYDVILVETVGVGQSEVSVRSMTDFFLLIQLATQGDELQGIKKGVIELADGILVNKCDGSMVERSNLKRAELAGVLRFLSNTTPGWSPFCDVCSALSGLNIRETWLRLVEFKNKLESDGLFQERRNLQKVEWFKSLLDHEVLRRFYSKEGFSNAVDYYKMLVEDDKINVAKAVRNLLDSQLK